MAGKKTSAKKNVKVGKLTSPTKELSKREQKKVKGGVKSLDEAAQELRLQSGNKALWGFQPLNRSGLTSDEDNQ